MTWFRNLVQLSSIKEPIRKRIATPNLLTSLSHFSSDTSNGVSEFSGLEPTKPDQKPRVVVLGSGWAGCRLMKSINTKIYDVVCVSPRNHMVFTPLLASTCVGTLEFRSVAEPIGRIQPAISRAPGSYFYLANCTGLDANNHVVCYLQFRYIPAVQLGTSFWLLFFSLIVLCLYVVLFQGVYECNGVPLAASLVFKAYKFEPSRAKIKVG